MLSDCLIAPEELPLAERARKDIYCMRRMIQKPLDDDRSAHIIPRVRTLVDPIGQSLIKQ